MKKLLRTLAIAAGSIVLVIGALLGAAIGTEYRPGPVVEEPVTERRAATPLQVGEPFDLLSWNVQFGAGRKHKFFYDGGDAVKVPRADVDEAVAAIGAALRGADADLTLIQEIDVDSSRTHGVDELDAWSRALDAAVTTTAPYHKVPFVPKPFTNPMGRVDMRLGIFSRAPLSHARRTQLALLDEPRIIQVFNLKRAMLTADVALEGSDRPLKVAVTHLSAFSFGDGTLSKQVATLDAWMSSHAPDQPWILAGDMNLLPTGDDKARLETERDLYADADSPIDPLLEKYREVLGNDRQLDPRHRTYLPFGYAEPDRKIDYVFVGGPVTVLEARVMREHSALSDHLPILARLRIGPAPEPAPDATEDQPITEE